MRPFHPRTQLRTTHALAAGLLTGTLLVGTAAAQTTSAPAAPAGATAGASAGSSAAPASQPAATAPSSGAPNTSAAAAPVPAEGKPLATSASGQAAAEAAPAPSKPAPPPDPKTRAKARKAYDQATRAYKKGDFAAALAGFQEAESLIASANAEYWIAASLDKLERPAEALQAYETCLANPEASKLGEGRYEEAKIRLEALRQTVPGTVTLSVTPSDATITVDGQAQAGPMPLNLSLPPGEHKISVAASGYEPSEVTVVVVGGKQQDQAIALTAVPPPPPPPEPVAAPPPPPPPPPPAEPKSMLPAYVTLGIATVATGVGTYFGIKALSAKSDYDDHPTQDKASDVEDNALIADMAFGVAITLGVTGIVLLTSPDEEPTTARKTTFQPRRVAVGPWASPRGGGAAAQVNF